MANWFIALPVEQHDWLPTLTQTCPQGIQLFAPDDLHLTISFLGGVTEQAASKAWALLYKKRNSLPALGPVHLDTLHPMGPKDKYSALSFHLKDDVKADDVRGFMRRWRDDLLAEADQPAENRDPLPHITVARPTRGGAGQSEASIRQRGEIWAKSVIPPAEPIIFSSVALFTWSERKGDTLFRIVERIPLPEPKRSLF